MTRVRTSISLVITAILLALVLQKVGVPELLAALRDANIGFIALAFIVGHVTFLPKVLNWQQLLRAQGHSVPFLSLLRLYFVGVFFNNMLPTNVGGDVVRSYEVGRHISDQATGLATVFVERLTGLVVLVALAVIASVTQFDQMDSPLLTFAVASASLGLIAITWVAFDPAMLDLTIRLSPPSIARQLSRLKKFQTALHRYRGQRSLWVNSAILSLMFNAGVVLYMYFAVSAFHTPVSFSGVFFIVPITMVLGMMPFAFNGVGLQEWACVLLFPRIGVPGSVALSAMLLIRAITLFTSVMGGLLYLQLKARQARSGVVAVEPSSVRPS